MDSLIFEEIKEVHLKEVMDIYNYYVINSTFAERKSA
jgi:hypothetical protein